MVKLSEDVELYYHFWFRLNDLYATWAKNHGFTANTLYVLAVIDTAQEDCTLRSICDKLLLPKQTVHAILQKLEEQGILERSAAAADKRIKILRLTKKGRAYTQKHLNPLYQIEEEALLKMGAAQKAAFHEHTQLFLEKLEESFTEEERK